MKLDLRIPIGTLFLALGVLLSGYGALTMGSDIYQRSLGINVNLWWGMLLAIFGAVMLIPAWLKRRKTD